MRQGAAFRFIPELVGDATHVMELSGNPNLLYIEAAIGTLHMAVDVFEAVEEHINTKRKKESEQVIQKRYRELADIRTKNYREEELRAIDITFEDVKAEIRDGHFRDDAVRGFIDSLKFELHKVLDIFSRIQMDPDYPDRAKIEELTRKSLRDYNKLLSIYIEEGNEDG